MDVVTLGAALNGSAEYVNSHFKGGSNIEIVDNPDGTQTINASGEVSSEDTVARAEIAAIKDGETLDSFGDVETALDDKANTATTYTKTEVDTALSAKANSVDVYSKTAVDTALGNKADKSATYTKTEVDTALNAKANATDVYSKSDVDTALNGKVDKETGKRLSTNDYTTAEKTKLAGIAEGAEVNVQSNWAQTTTTADDYIKNKPTLGTAAAKNATDTYNATGNDVTTGKAVAAALATLPEPMVFKGSLGTGGTITTLPTASGSNKGYVYKVITAGTYASQSAKVGDTFISDGSAWVLIPSGDEPSGTVTNVAVANGGGLTVSGSPITSSGTITVGHSNSVTAKTSSSVKKFTYDEYGHVTGSSELSTAESDALASGIDSTKVEQIETNKNNILSNTLNGGGINKFQVTATTTTVNGITFTVNADKTITATGSIADSSQNVIFTMGTYTAVSGDVLSEGLEEANPKAYIYARGGSTALTGVTYKAIAASDIGVRREYACAILGSVVGQVNITFKPMICNSDSYVKSGVYQPFALSNVELTTKEQTNENNISFAVEKIGNNLVNVPSGSGVRWIDVPVNIPTGVYTLGFSNLSGNDSRQSQVSFYSGDSGFYAYIDKGNDVYINNVTFTNTVTSIRIYASTNSTTSLNQGVNFTTLFLCKQETWNPSVGIQPYAMSNAELTAAIQALQAQLANQ